MYGRGCVQQHHRLGGSINAGALSSVSADGQFLCLLRLERDRMVSHIWRFMICIRWSTLNKTLVRFRAHVRHLQRNFFDALLDAIVLKLTEPL